MPIINHETSMLRRVAGDFPRHPHQVNGLLEADAEIIKRIRPEGGYLVLKTDAIHEEIKEKLYEDPYLAGWMAITAPVSDIAAVGATPEGVLLSLILPNSYTGEWLAQFKSGINDACGQYKIYILGGDTNFDTHLSISATVVADISDGKPSMRTGMKPGDNLYTTALLGDGGAYAFTHYFDKDLKIGYRPVARLAEGLMIRKFAGACTDTSDGLFPTLAVLSEVNGVGFNIEPPLSEILSASALTVQRRAQLPEFTLLAGPHGEYELLFTVPETVHNHFGDFCKNEKWHPRFIGKVRSDIGVSFLLDNRRVECDPSGIANLFHEAGGNPSTYLELLMRQYHSWQK